MNRLARQFSLGMLMGISLGSHVSHFQSGDKLYAVIFVVLTLVIGLVLFYDNLMRD